MSERLELIARLASVILRSAEHRRYLIGENLRRKRSLRKKTLRQINATNRRRRNRSIIKAARATTCADCGRFREKHMSFDHLPGFKKSFNLCDGGKRPRSLKKIYDELAKCEVVCCDCHRAREASRGRSHGCRQCRREARLAKVSEARQTSRPP